MTGVWICIVFIIGLWDGVSEASLCTARGRFPNENAPDCRGYTMCLSGAPGIFTQYDLNCPETFVYSHMDNQCTNITGYQCYPQYKCTTEGTFADETDKNCTTYIACVQGLNQIATARLVHCPENTLYSPLNATCVNRTTFTCDMNEPPTVLDALPSQDPDDSSSNTNNAVRLCCKVCLLVYLMFSLAM